MTIRTALKKKSLSDVSTETNAPTVRPYVGFRFTRGEQKRLVSTHSETPLRNPDPDTFTRDDDGNTKAPVQRYRFQYVILNRGNVQVACRVFVPVFDQADDVDLG